MRRVQVRGRGRGGVDNDGVPIGWEMRDDRRTTSVLPLVFGPVISMPSRAPGTWQGRYLTSVEDGDRALMRVQARNGLLLQRLHPRMIRPSRRMPLDATFMGPGGWRKRGLRDGRHRWKVIRPSLDRPVLLQGLVSRILICARTRPRGPFLRHINDERIVYHLATGKVAVDRSAYILFRAYYPLMSLLARLDPLQNAKCHIWGVKGAAEAIGVLFQDHVPHVVD